MRHLLKVAAVAMTIATTNEAGAATAPEINTILMETTFQITRPSKNVKGATTSGTGFIVGKPSKQGDVNYFVLVTAAHVVDEISGDFAAINVREKQPDGSYRVTLRQLQIRSQGKDIYVKHKSVDVAAIYTGLPASYGGITQIGDALLASDADLTKYEVHPGDEMFCLGYPLGASGSHGFPILRSGKIGSYPLVPAHEHKNWLFDFRVFQGNSGGPVYMVDHNRQYGGNVHIGETLQMVIGLVTQQLSADVGSGARELQIGVVIPALFIKETMDMLPEAPPTQQ